MNGIVATAARVIRQLRVDPRSVALVIVLPCVLLALIAWMFDGTDVLDDYGPMLLGIFPQLVLFLVTSVATLRERQSGTLERLMTTPISRGALVGGYALAFAGLALVQAVVIVLVALLLGMDVQGSLVMMVFVAMLNAVLGCGLGLAASSAARTEFQAVQMMPAVLFPQLITCGLLMPRDQMPELLEWISRFFPLTYSVEAMQNLAAGDPLSQVWRPTAVTILFIVLVLVLGTLTLRRRTA